MARHKREHKDAPVVYRAANRRQTEPLEIDDETTQELPQPQAVSAPVTAGGKRRVSGWLIATLCAVCALVLGITLWALLVLNKTTPPVDEAPISIPRPVFSLPEASSEPEPEPQPEPEPAPQQVELAFTQEELDYLDTLLTDWAVAVTAPVGETADTPGEDEEASSSAIVFTPENYGHKVAVYFCDLDSGLTYVYNGGTQFLIASLNKAPYAMYLYTLAERGELDLNETFHVTAAMLEASAENSGRLKDDATLPRDLTVEELIYEMLRYSDTGALRILLSRYGAAGYREWADETLDLVYPEEVKNITNSRISAEDAGVYLHALYQYMEYGAYGAQLKEHLLNTRNAMIKSDAPVARKYGWDIQSFHDMAVVYEEHPYVLAILTDKSYGTWGETAKFAEITAVFEEMLHAKWAEATAEPG